jgi:SAM-dependent methyltransferase
MIELNKYIDRTKSCLDGGEDLESLYSHKQFPIYFGVTDAKIEDDIYAEMSWSIQKSTGVIQLSRLIPLDLLYQSQHAFGVGNTWENHYQQFSEFLIRQGAVRVLDIGGGQGKIATICTSKKSNISFTIIDPNPFVAQSKQIEIVRGFFGVTPIAGDFDTYSFSHVLEHIYDPVEFLGSIFEKMSSSDKLVFSYPNLEEWLKNKFTNALNFEHTLYLNESHLDTILSNVGFEIVEKKYFENHSLFYSLKKSNNVISLKKYEDCYERNKNLFLNFINYHLSEVENLNEIIGKAKGPVFLFGAHIFSQYLAIAGLNISEIEAILDNSQEKQNKRLYGTHLVVKSPRILESYESPIVILRAGPYNDEIQSDILENINPQTVFI